MHGGGMERCGFSAVIEFRKDNSSRNCAASWKMETERVRDGLPFSEDVVVATPAAAPALGEPMDLMTALQLIMKKSLTHDGLIHSLHEGAKAIEKHIVKLCILTEDCNQPDYVKLVKALCMDHNVHLVTVPSAKSLGEWDGSAKLT